MRWGLYWEHLHSIITIKAAEVARLRRGIELIKRRIPWKEEKIFDP